MGKVTCEACSRSCKGQAIRLSDKYFHIKCFRCHECRKPLATGGFYTKDNAHYCVEDYQRLYGTKCLICGQFVEGDVVIALGNSYHEHCFHCTACQKRFSAGDKVTYVGEQYLCNLCLDETLRSTTDVSQGALQGALVDGNGHQGALVDSQVAPLSSTDDDEDFQAKKLKPMQVRGTTSAPVTPAKQSALKRKEGNISSSPALDVTDVDGCIDINRTFISPGVTNTSGYKSAEVSSFDNYLVTNGNRSQDSIDLPDTSSSHYHGRLSPIHNIMRYRSVSPAWSTTSHKSKDSAESNGGTPGGRSSRFDADYGKFYKSSYLEKGVEFRRGPSLNLVNTHRDNSPRHYHRPENFSYSSVRRDIVRPTRKGLLTLLGDREYLNVLKHYSPYKPDKTQEPIQLSKIPDAQKDAGHIAPIERDDWPAPPAPAAAYPELLRDRRLIRPRSVADIDNIDGSRNKENLVTNGELSDSDSDIDKTDVRTDREIKELSKMTDSGAARVILEDLKRKQHEKLVLDPRSASRTPSAAQEPAYRPRYDSPLFASPSRDNDMRLRLRSCDNLTERKYRTAALPLSNVPVPRPGYTHTKNMDWKNRFSFEGLDELEPQRPVSSAGELHRNIYSSQSSIDVFDPTTGLRKRCRSATMSEGVVSPYFGYRRSVPSLYNEPSKVYTCAELQEMVEKQRFAPEVDKETLEHYLVREEFETLFGMKCEEFYRLAQWKRNDLKMRAGLY